MTRQTVKMWQDEQAANRPMTDLDGRPLDHHRQQHIVDMIRYARQRRDTGLGSVYDNLKAVLGEAEADLAMANLMWADKGFAPALKA